jgi:hypothetical protein
MGKKSIHRIVYLQAKLLLDPGRLSSVGQFRDFGKRVQRTAESLEIGFIDDPNVFLAPRVREVIFVDTPDFRLYKSGFILRRRIPYVEGFPAGDPEIVFKYRHPDAGRAAALDVRPRISGKYRIKFKVQALPARDRLGGYRLLYSHNCQFGVSQVHEADRLAMSTLSRVIPAIGSVRTSKRQRVTLVNESVVEELLLPLGELDFGKGIVAKSNVALWRTRGDHQPVVGEYSFQMKLDREEEVPRKAEKRVKQFFVRLQYDLKDLIALGSTKTGLVYRLKNNAIQGHD